MAINLTDFDKIWASSSPLTPYSFSDANYEEGWNFVGSTPPARQMWDSYMKWSDEKQQWIVNNFLPLSGGNITGSLTVQSNTVLTDNVQTINDLSTIITYNSGYSNRGGTLHLIAGFLVMIKVGVNFANAVSANTNVTVGTIASAYRPPNDAFGGGVDCTIAIGSDGSVSLRPLVNKNANSWSWTTILYTLI